ncbi:MAG: PEPxxWA-CTERM sorting domain-containing protein [Caulobacteraceae bacterium]
MALAIGSVANAATNVVVNGSFENTSYSASSQFGGTGSFFAYGGQGVTNWTGNSGLNEWFKGGTQSTVGAANFWGDPLNYFNNSVVASPDGGSFVALDGDSTVRGGISQQITGLEVGKTYTLTFDWAAAQLLNRTGPTTEQLQVTFGSQTQLTDVLSIASQGFSGWKGVTMLFTATNATQTLSFLSIGTPDGLPPVALLDGVSLTVPEPATWAMMIMGFGTLGLMMRRRRMVTAA